MHMTKKVRITISEPWELSEFPLEGIIIMEKDDALIIQLITPITYKNIIGEYFMARLRSNAENIASFIDKKHGVFNLVNIPVNAIQSKNPFDISSWRGGIGLICDIDICL